MTFDFRLPKQDSIRHRIQPVVHFRKYASALALFATYSDHSVLVLAAAVSPDRTLLHNFTDSAFAHNNASNGRGTQGGTGLRIRSHTWGSIVLRSRAETVFCSLYRVTCPVPPAADRTATGLWGRRPTEEGGRRSSAGIRRLQHFASGRERECCDFAYNRGSVKCYGVRRCFECRSHLSKCSPFANVAYDPYSSSDLTPIPATQLVNVIVFHLEL